MTSPRRLALLALLPLLGTLLVACGDEDTSSRAAPREKCTYSDDNRPAAKQVDKPEGNPPSDLPSEMTIKTDRGNIQVSLDADKAPCAVNSFVSLAKQGFFDATACHRLTGSGGLFILQCGDPTGTSSGGPGYEFGDELVDQDPRLQPCLGQVDPQSGREICTYTTGTVAMANGGPDTNGSQFFLIYQDSYLPAAYTVFGKMSAAGVKVVQSVAKGGVAADGSTPATPIEIESVTAAQKSQ